MNTLNFPAASFEVLCSPDGVPKDLRVRDVNNAFEKLTGIPKKRYFREKLSVIWQNPVWFEAFLKLMKCSAFFPEISQPAGEFEILGKKYQLLFIPEKRKLLTVIFIPCDTSLEKIQNDALPFHLNSIASTTPDILYIFSLKENKNIFSNTRISDILGYSTEEIKAMGDEVLTSLVYEDDKEYVRKHLQKLDKIRLNEVIESEYRMVHKEGFPVRLFGREMCLKRDEDGNAEWIIGFVSDISARKNQEEMLAARLSILEIAATGNLDKVLQLTLDKAEELTGSRIGFYHFLSGDEKTIHLQQWSTSTLKNVCSTSGFDRHYDIENAGIWVDCVKLRRPVIHNDYLKEIHRKGLPEGHAPVTRELVVPVFRNKKIVAILGVGNKSRAYRDEDIAVVSTLADLAWDIADRLQIQEQLNRREKEYRHLLQNLPDVVYRFSSKRGGFFYAGASENLLGYPADYLMDHPFHWFHSIHPLDTHSISSILNTIHPDKKEITYRIMHKDQSWRWVRDRVIRITDNGEERIIEGIASDITVEQQARFVLEESEKNLSHIFKNIPQAILIVDLDTGAIQEVNEQFLHLTGYNREEVLGHTTLNLKLVDPDQRHKLYAILNQKKEVPSTELVYSTRKGVKKTCLASGSIIWYRGKDHLMAVMTDIEEIKKQQDALRKSEEKYAGMFRNAPVGMFRSTPEGKFIEVNQSLAKMLGYEDPEEVLSSIKNIQEDIYVIGSRREIIVKETLKRDDFNIYENLYRRKDGSTFKGRLYLRKLNEPGTGKLYLEGIVEDLSEILKVQKAEEEKNAFIRSVAEASPDIFYVFDLELGKNIYVNKAIGNILGYTDSEIHAMGDQMLVRLIHPDDLPRIIEENKQLPFLKNQEIFSTQYRMQHKNGNWHYLAGKVSVFKRNALGNVSQIVGFAHDITLEKNAENLTREAQEKLRNFSLYQQELLEKEKIHIAREIHDDLGQLLTAMKLGLARLSKKESFPDNQDAGQFAELLDLNERLIQKVKNISARLRPSILDNLGLIPALEWFIEDFERKTRIKTEFRLSPASLSIPPEWYEHLYRIVQEALTNIARHSRSETAFITLSQKRDHIELTVEDHGIGIAQEQIHGTHSFGIIGMQERVHLMKGRFQMDSLPGNGCIIKITLPEK